MSAAFSILNNAVILSILKRYLGPTYWAHFLVSMCNPSAVTSAPCMCWGLTVYLGQLQNPLVDYWQYDESREIITI